MLISTKKRVLPNPSQLRNNLRAGPDFYNFQITFPLPLLNHQIIYRPIPLPLDSTIRLSPLLRGEHHRINVDPTVEEYLRLVVEYPSLRRRTCFSGFPLQDPRLKARRFLGIESSPPSVACVADG